MVVKVAVCRSYEFGVKILDIWEWNLNYLYIYGFIYVYLSGWGPYDGSSSWFFFILVVCTYYYYVYNNLYTYNMTYVCCIIYFNALTWVVISAVCDSNIMLRWLQTYYYLDGVSFDCHLSLWQRYLYTN